MTARPPGPVRRHAVKGLARLGAARATAETAKCVDAGPCIAQGGYSPMTRPEFTGAATGLAGAASRIRPRRAAPPMRDAARHGRPARCDNFNPAGASRAKAAPCPARAASACAANRRGARPAASRRRRTMVALWYEGDAARRLLAVQRTSDAADRRAALAAALELRLGERALDLGDGPGARGAAPRRPCGTVRYAGASPAPVQARAARRWSSAALGCRRTPKLTARCMARRAHRFARRW